MKTESILRHHLTLCEVAYRLLLEENQILKSTGMPPEKTFLRKKQNLLPMLDKSLESLRDVRDSLEVKEDPCRALVLDAQKKLMKVFLLDRENEQLLLKVSLNSMTGRMSRPGQSEEFPALDRLSSGQLDRSYGKQYAQDDN